MERYYGVIKDTDTAAEFVMALTKASTTDAGCAIKTSSYPISRVDDPLYGFSVSWFDTFISKAQTVGYMQQSSSDSAKSTVINSLTKDAISSYDGQLDTSKDVVAALGDKTFIVIHPKDDEASGIQARTRMRLVQKITNTVQTETTNPETGESTATSITTTRTNNCDLYYWGNSSAYATAIAYEITKTYSGDVLVKIATCAPDTLDTETFLKPIFSQLSICNYEAWIDGAGYDSAAIRISQGQFTAKQKAFGDNVVGCFGGFVLHQMKNKKEDSSIYGEMNPNEPTYGLTIFYYDGTPLYTWSDSSAPWDELNSTKTAWVNINHQIGKKIDGTLTNPNNLKSAPIIKMAALAPIVCPSMQDIAKYAKWLFQSPHNYSYFDKSGHLYLKGAGSTSELANSNDNVFFMDYGIALWDGPLSEFELSNKSIPDVNPENLGMYKRPVIDDPMPYGASDFYAYFDSKSGLSTSGWMNVNDENNDMEFDGAPTINTNGSLHFDFGVSASFGGDFASSAYPTIYIVFWPRNLSGISDDWAMPLLNMSNGASSAEGVALVMDRVSWGSHSEVSFTSAFRPSDNNNRDRSQIAVASGSGDYTYVEGAPIVAQILKIAARTFVRFIYKNKLLTAEPPNNTGRTYSSIDDTWNIGSKVKSSAGTSNMLRMSRNWTAYTFTPGDGNTTASFDLAFLAIGNASGSSIPTAAANVDANLEYLAHRFNTVDQYSQKAYAASEYCMHDGKLYRAKAAITSEVWTEAHWDLRRE